MAKHQTYVVIIGLLVTIFVVEFIAFSKMGGSKEGLTPKEAAQKQVDDLQKDYDKKLSQCNKATADYNDFFNNPANRTVSDYTIKLSNKHNKKIERCIEKRVVGNKLNSAKKQLESVN